MPKNKNRLWKLIIFHWEITRIKMILWNILKRLQVIMWMWTNQVTILKLKNSKRLIQLQLGRSKLLTCKECVILLIVKLMIDFKWLLLKTYFLDQCPVVLLWTKTSEPVLNLLLDKFVKTEDATQITDQVIYRQKWL